MGDIGREPGAGRFLEPEGDDITDATIGQNGRSCRQSAKSESPQEFCPLRDSGLAAAAMLSRN